MQHVILRRTMQMPPMLVLLSMVVFALLAAAPGDPARKALATGGAGDQVDERDVAAKRLELGLDRPLWQRYLAWSADAARLDLGESYVTKRPVRDLIAERLPASATLAGISLAVAAVLSIPLGIVAAVRAGGWLDSLIRLLTISWASVPSFWLALMAMWLFGVKLHWFPVLGDFSARGMVLPVAVLALRTVGLLSRLTRAAMLEALSLECIPVARAKGLRERTIIFRHALPNALIPLLTVIGLDFAALLAHASIIEWVFAWPGVGRMAVDASIAGDVPVVLGYVLTISVTVVLTNLVVDICYGLADPRL